MLSETWLKPSVFDSELFSDKYNVYRTDRSHLNSNKSKGGGVLIAVNSSYPSEIIDVDGSAEIEIVCIKVRFHNYNIFACCLYVPPGSDQLIYSKYCDTLNNFVIETNCDNSDIILIVGDFNLPLIEWHADLDKSNTFLPVNVSSSECVVLDSLFSNGLYQLNSFCNYIDRLLDLVFCTECDDVTVTKCSKPLTKIDLNHAPIEICFDFATVNSSTFSNKTPSRNYNFKKANYIGLNNFFKTVNWISMFGNSDINVAVDDFYDIVQFGIDTFVPVFTVKKCNAPSWYSRSLKKLRNKKVKSFKRYQLSKLPSDYSTYCDLRHQFSTAQNLEYKKYITETEINLTKDPAKFWSFVDSKKRSGGFPAVMVYDGISTEDGPSISELFADFFESVYVADDGVCRPDGFGLTERINVGSIALSEESILTAILSLNTKKGSGPDIISPFLLVNCAQTILMPIHYLFNLSLSVGAFPDRWKLSYITPIFKSGKRSHVINYRGIAILPTCGKLFELLVTDVLRFHLKPLLTILQNGFVEKRSAPGNLLEFTNFTTLSIENGYQVDVIYTDFSKAFDRIRHSFLLEKLHEIGIHSSMFLWLKSYLSNRSQCVNILGSKSRFFKVTSGVPQGSHLGPLLFIIFINDVANLFKYSKCLMYADDLKLFLSVKSILDAISLQSDIDLLSNWCQYNCLYLNINKCKAMSYHRNSSKINFEYMIDGCILETVNEIRDLGVYFVSNLCFTRHIELKIAKARAMLGFLKRSCYEFRNISALKSVYCAHVRSHLEYASIVWNPHSAVHNSRIESIQKQFVIYALRHLRLRADNYVLPSYNLRCKMVDLIALDQRRFNSRVFFMYDLLNGFIDAPNLLSLVKLIVPNYRFRRNDFLRTTFHRTLYGENEPFNVICRSFNEIAYLFDFNVSRYNFRNSILALH